MCSRETISESIEKLNKIDVDRICEFNNNVSQNCIGYLQNYIEDLKQQRMTYRQSTLTKNIVSHPEAKETEDKENENTENIQQKSESRSRRNASQAAAQKINVQSKLKLNKKLRRPTDVDENDLKLQLAEIKTEKDAEKANNDQAKSVNENIDEMPPPKITKLKKIKKVKTERISDEKETTRVTRSKRRNAVKANEKPIRSTTSKRTKSVIIQETPIVCIELSDTDDNDDSIKEPCTQTLVISTIDTESESYVTDDKSQPNEISSSEPEPSVSIKHKKRTKKYIKTKEVSSKATAKKEVSTVEPITDTSEAKDKSVYEDAVIQQKKLTVPINSEIMTTMQIATKDISQKVSLDSVRQEDKSEDRNTLSKQDTLSLQDTTKVNTNTPKNQKKLMDCTVVLHQVSMDNDTPLNKTVTLTNNSANKTITVSPVSGSKWKKAQETVQSPDNLLTDDDSLEITEKGKRTPASQTKRGVKNKAMFSPYANSPVHKRVAAFENFVKGIKVNSIASTTRVTRTKKRMLEKQENVVQNVPETSTRTNLMSPFSKIPYLIPSTDSKVMNKCVNSTMHNTTSSSDVSKSMMMSSTVKSKFDLKKKEEDGQRKKDALLQAKIEEQKRKREEKQLKVQKAREAMVKEKEEKYRQLLVEKKVKLEEIRKNQELVRLIKIKEEEQKRLLIKKKQEDEKKRAEEPTKPPPLPTEDEDDSDSGDEYPTSRNPAPAWAQKEQLTKTLKVMSNIPQKEVVERFFGTQATTPDLQQIFQSIDHRLLRRNSSAVWKTPPRYSQMPKL